MNDSVINKNGASGGSHYLLANKTPEKQFTCHICGKQFPQSCTLRKHLLIHSGVKPFSCEVCNKSFIEAHSLRKHMMIHNTGREKPHVCSVCGKRYYLPSHLKAHIRKHHADEALYKCDVCDEEFKYALDLREHKIATHCQVANISVRRHMMTTTNSEDKPYSCEVCEKSFKYPDSLEVHMKLHEERNDISTELQPSEVHTCHICGEMLTHASLLQRHLVTVHGEEKPFPCNVCDKRFYLKSELVSHMKEHSDERPFSCHVCNRTFKDPRNLKVHLKIHDPTRERTHACNICDRRFYSKSQLRYHRFVHSDEKPIQCNMCNKSFKTSLYLRQHIKHTHQKKTSETSDTRQIDNDNSDNAKDNLPERMVDTGGSCHVCNRTFKDPRNLKVHLKIHDPTRERTHACNICDRRFYLKSQLRYHRFVHSNEKPIQCNMCSKSFKTSLYLRQHIKHTHQKKTSETSDTRQDDDDNSDNAKDNLPERMVDTSLDIKGNQHDKDDDLGDVKDSLPEKMDDSSLDNETHQQDRDDDSDDDCVPELVEDEEIKPNEDQESTEGLVVKQEYNTEVYEDELHENDESHYEKVVVKQELNIDYGEGEMGTIAHQQESTSSADVSIKQEDTSFMNDRMLADYSGQVTDMLLGGMDDKATIKLDLHTEDPSKDNQEPDGDSINQANVDVDPVKSCDDSVNRRELPLQKDFDRLSPSNNDDDFFPLSEKNFPCEMCGKRFSTNGERKKHMRSHSDERPYSCDVCQKAFKDRPTLKYHMTTHDADREKPHVCSVCNNSYLRSSHLRKHMLKHTGERPFQCDKCSKEFQLHGTLMQHMATHTGEKPHMCSICNKCFTQKGGLNRHMLLHSGEKPHICEVCGKRFTQSSHLKNHVQRHSEIGSGAKSGSGESYTCTFCFKEFSKTGLRYHLLKHTGVKQHTCETCNKSFLDVSTLRVHMRTHNKEKPHICNMCGKKYKTLKTLKVHKLLHEPN